MKELEDQFCNLNIRYDLPLEVFNKVEDVYKKMPGWKGYGDGINGYKSIPYWFGFNENEKFISASVEPSGLSFAAKMENEEWEQWIKTFKEIATKKLCFKVGEIETGEVTKEIE